MKGRDGAVLGALILLTTVATLQKVMGVSAPQPAGDAPQVLMLAGYRVASLGTRAGRRTREISHAPIQRFTLQPEKGGNPIVLTLIPVRQRTEATLHLAGLAAIEPGFSLMNRRLLEVPVVSAEKGPFRLDQVAVGFATNDHNNLSSRLQTCLTASGEGAVTAAMLHAALTRQRHLEVSRSPLSTLLARHIGHKPNPGWECLAVQLESSELSYPEKSLLPIWTKLRKELIDHLRKSDPTPG
jgi:hypothetical protein